MKWPQGSTIKHVFVGIGLVLSILLGTLLKPNIIVLLPAIAIMGLILARKKLFKKSRLLAPIILIILGFGLSLPATHMIDHASHYTPEAKYAFPTSHWLLMGVNAAHHGMYSGKDTERDIKLPSKATRNQYDVNHISKRVKKLGLTGLIKLWTIKLGILLNVRGIQNWYNGGFRSAPSWYQRHVKFFKELTIISYAAATLTLWFTLIRRLLVWRPALSDSEQVVGLLAVITALGYFAFHTLFWEVEPRYGQAALPLIWIILAVTPVSAGDKQRIKKLPQVLAPISMAVTLFAFFGFAGILGHSQLKNMVVAAQRSQLSTQYHAKPTMMQPGQAITEDVTLHGSANHVSVQVHDKSKIRTSLEDLTTHAKFQLHNQGRSFRLHRHLKAGQYRITVQNNTQKKQPVNVVQTYHYQLANHPLIINGRANKNASLVYTFSTTPLKGVVINS